MALVFKVEALAEKVIIHVKGNIIRISYHAASCLCRNIYEACEKHREFRKNHYWFEQYRKHRKVRVKPDNKALYNEFLDAMNKTDTIRGGSKPTRARSIKEEERKAAMQAKIRELQERHHIKPKKRENDDENS